MAAGVFMAVAVVLGILIGGIFVVGAPVFAVPILLVFAGGAMALLFLRRAREARDMRTFREQAEAGTDFSARDKETQTHQ